MILELLSILERQHEFNLDFGVNDEKLEAEIKRLKQFVAMGKKIQSNCLLTK